MITKLTQRRSIRNYTMEPIPEEKLRTILMAGLLSPTSKNLRPWEFLVVQDKETLKRLSDCREQGADMLKGADAAILVMADTTINDVWIEDCSIAMSNMHLAAADEGVGSCWIQIRNRKSRAEEKSSGQYLKDLFSLEPQYEVEAILSLGMPKKIKDAITLNQELWKKVHYETFHK